MERGIIYTRGREDSTMQPWKQLILLLKYAKEIDFLDMGIISVTEDDNQHNRSSIEQLHAMLKKHACHSVLVMDLNCLSDNPAELALINERFVSEGITVFSLF